MGDGGEGGGGDEAGEADEAEDGVVVEEGSGVVDRVGCEGEVGDTGEYDAGEDAPDTPVLPGEVKGVAFVVDEAADRCGQQDHGNGIK